MSAQGSKANKSGYFFEQQVVDHLEKLGFDVTTDIEYLEYRSPDLFTTIGKSDVCILKDEITPTVRIECKASNVAGSNWQKNYIPWVTMERGHFPEPYTILLLSGNWDSWIPNHIPELKAFSDFKAEKGDGRIHVLDWDKGELDVFLESIRHELK